MASVTMLACEADDGLILGGEEDVTGPQTQEPDGDGTVTEPDATVTDDVEPALPDVAVSDADILIDVPALGPGDCPPGSGCFGEPCNENSDCQSGWCVDHMGGGVCSEPCEELCPDGWSCEAVAGSGTDLVYICVSNHTNLCRPCNEPSDCLSAQGTEDACVSYGEEGSFCGGVCDEDHPCPDGFTCQDAETVDGVPTKQCVNDAGVCECTEKSENLALYTGCSTQNEWGTCTGMRVCTGEGLSSCDALNPAEEVCNGVDDDCDGETDEVVCDDDNDCTQDVCAGEDGCLHTELVDAPCNDGDACTFGDLCSAGTCKGDALTCEDQNPCTDDSCDGELGCLYEPNDDPCSDGEPCTMADVCEGGSCAAGQEIECDDGNPCTSDECGGDLGCSHVALDGGPCDDGNACTVDDQCSAGLCGSVGIEDCDDGNPCTTDICNPNAGGCVYENNQIPCDDGSVCTSGDQCSAGACVSGGTIVQCDDGNPCTQDACDS